MPVTLLQSAIYAFVALGIMIPFRLLSFPDLTVEGSFPLGGCVAAALIAANIDPVAATVAAMLAGLVAGLATATIHLTLRLNTLLCGILVLTMLFSIDIRIMGKPNTALFAHATIFDNLLGTLAGSLLVRTAAVGVLLAGLALALLWFFRTEIGMALRAVGASHSMARAQGLSVGRYTLLGLGLAGSLCALSGALLAQNQAFADVGMGFGIRGQRARLGGRWRATDWPRLARPATAGADRRRVRLLPDRQPRARRRSSAVRPQAGDRVFVLIMLGVPLLKGRAGRSNMPA